MPRAQPPAGVPGLPAVSQILQPRGLCPFLLLLTFTDNCLNMLVLVSCDRMNWRSWPSIIDLTKEFNSRTICIKFFFFVKQEVFPMYSPPVTIFRLNIIVAQNIVFRFSLSAACLFLVLVFFRISYCAILRLKINALFG